MPTVLYGVHEMRLPTSCCKRFVSMINLHYRRMIHPPVHLTHENTTDFFLRLGVQPPWIHIAEHHRKLTTALAHKHQSLMEPDEPQPDVCTLSPAYPPCATHEYVPPTHRCPRPCWPARSAIDNLPRQGCSRSIFVNSIRSHVYRKTYFDR